MDDSKPDRREPIQPLVILGAGGFALEVADLIRDIPALRVTAFAQNVDPSQRGSFLESLPVMWLEETADLAKDHLALAAIGSPRRKAIIDQAAVLGFAFASVTHPTARVSASLRLGDGTLLAAGVVTAAHCRIGRHVIVNRGALLGHHTEIHDYVTIGPGANIAGSCLVGQGAQIGMGSIILDHIRVGRHSIVGSGSVVTKDVPDHVQVLGVPARITKELPPREPQS